jgi:hypothetical protein
VSTSGEENRQAAPELITPELHALPVAARIDEVDELEAVSALAPVVELPVGPTWNGRLSNGTPNGHAHDRVRIRRVTRYEPEPKETSLLDKLFARLGIQGQKLA